MRKRLQFLVAMIALAFFLSGCQVQGTQIPALWRPLPDRPLYALRGGWYYSDNFNNALFIIDPESWSVVRRTHLPRALSPQIDQDPQGRLWIGLGATASLFPDAKGMLVFSPGGRRLAKLDTCDDPITGVEFTDDKAYVICALNGFSARIDVFDLRTFEKIDSMPLDATGVGSSKYTLARSGGTALIDHYILIDGSPEYIDWGVNIETSVLTLIDTTHMQIADQTDAIPGVRLREILPYQNKFYGLNAVREEEKFNSAETSLFVIEPGPPMKIARRPLALTNAMHGKIDGDLLYILHSGTRSWPLFDGETGEPLGYEREGIFYPYTESTNWQALSTYNLQNDEAELLWFLEAKDPSVSDIDNPYPNASDMTIIDGEIILISDERDHIYRWNREKNVMEAVMDLKDAGRLLLGKAR